MIESKAFIKKYLICCPKCGHAFYPWNALMVTSPKTKWKEYLYCPSCQYFADKEEFKIG